MTEYALIVAGGKGSRMGTDLPKQFLPLAGKPVLMHTMEAFYTYNPDIQMIVVLPHSQQEFWADLCEKHHFVKPHRVVDGGETRFHSVKNGLAWVKEPALVGVHDGVRPFVSQEVITRCYRQAADCQAVIPVVDVIESLRCVDAENRSHPVDRSLYKLVQTPQVFEASLLKAAYEQPYQSCFTDDASVVEAMGKAVAWVEGNRENVKITTPFDWKVASVLVNACTI